MSELFFVRYRENGKRPSKIAGVFQSKNEAEGYRSKLLSGSGGLFGMYHDVYISKRNVPSVKRKA